MEKESPNKEPLRIGHRGACGFAPENTLASIKRAIAIGCAFTEVDVRRTADGALILLHDEYVDRTTSGQGLITELTIEEAQKLDAGDGQTLPTLEEVLTVATDKIGLILELKTGGLAYDARAIVRASGFAGPVIYASFLHEELQHVRRVDPGSKTLILFKRLPREPETQAARIEATHVGLRFDTATKPLVKTLQRAHLPVFAYTVNKPADISRLKRLGVDGLISDFPDRL